jgi:uncharacterized membrane protein HdeD (DUF308 family)
VRLNLAFWPAENVARNARTSRRLTRPTKALAAAVAVFAAASIVLPATTGAEVLRAIGPILAVGGVLLGVAKYRPRRSLGRMLMATRLALQTAAILVFANRYFAGEDTFSSMTDLLRLLAVLLSRSTS